MPSVRKPRSDSVSAAVNAHKVAREAPPLNWPTHLIDLPSDDGEREQVLTVFEDMQRARDPNWWRPHHALNLAEVSLLQCQRSKLISLLAQTGALTTSGGRTARSPVLDALSMVTSNITQCLKPLGISVSQLERDAHSHNANAARNTLDSRDPRRLLARGPDDDLLA